MKGESSKSKLFKNFPILYMNSYQGSKTSTSKGIKFIFDKARKIIENNKSKIISLIYFDEMGLAEISNNNPLKVLHSELEYDEHENKIAFIGISNWALDASKMNRGIFLSIPEPGEKDLKITAKTIADSYDSSLITNYKDIFENLAVSYQKYINYVEENHTDYKNFHGLRDFYYLIKQTSKIILKEKVINENNAINKSLSCIERNFGGLDFSVYEFKKIFTKENIQISKYYDIIQNIENNIKEIEKDQQISVRYLMIITKSAIGQYLIDYLLKEKLNKKYTFYLGSNFSDDIQQDYYMAQVINKIQISMEIGETIVLKNLDSIYPSFYDLFNQNFTYSGKRYVRIALGNSNNIPYEVNEEFKCIILVDEDRLNYQDPPFINRFEKYYLTFESILPQRLLEFSNKEYEIIKDILNLELNNKKFKYFDNHNICLNKDEITGLIYKFKDEKNIENKILEKISPLFSEEILTYIKFSGFYRKYENIYNDIISFYGKKEHCNFNEFLKAMNNNKNIIYTFSNIFEKLDFNIKNEIKNEIFSNYEKENKTILINVNNFNSESEIEETIEKFFINKDKNLLIFNVDKSNFQHLNHLNFLYEKCEKENENKNKFVIFIVHLQKYNEEKNEIYKYVISLLSNYSQIMIDNLKGKEILITDLINLTNIELFNNKLLFNYDQSFKTQIYEIFFSIIYQFKNKIIKENKEELSENEYINKLINFF